MIYQLRLTTINNRHFVKFCSWWICPETLVEHIWNITNWYYGMSKIFAISSLIMISFFVDIDLVWVEAPRWSLVILVVLFCKLITLRPGQRCKPCSLHILFNKVTQMFRFVAATPIDWWKCKVTLSIPQDLLVVWACCRDCSSIRKEMDANGVFDDSIWELRRASLIPTRHMFAPPLKWEQVPFCRELAFKLADVRRFALAK